MPMVVCACGSAEKDAGTQQNGLIAGNDGQGLVLVDPVDSSVRHVPRTVGGFDQAWSPDGSRLAFTKDRGNEEYDVYTVRPDGSGLERVLENAMSPTWSADGNQLVVERDRCYEAFRRSDTDGVDCLIEFADRYSLSIVDSDGGDARPFTFGPAEGRYPAWSPDGEWIAFAEADGLYLVRPDGSHRHLLLGGDFSGSRGSSSRIDWSSDGSKLLFEVDEHRQLGFAVLDVDTQEKTNLTRTLGPAFAPSWSPDGKQIAFLAPTRCLRTHRCAGWADEPADVWLMDADGTDPRRIGAYGYPSWGPASADDAPSGD